MVSEKAAGHSQPVKSFNFQKLSVFNIPRQNAKSWTIMKDKVNREKMSIY